jgi:ribosomal protein L21E
MEFQKGDRVELIHTNDQYTKLRPGDTGTVTRVREDRMSGRTVGVQWDDGSCLTMLLDEGDRIKTVSVLPTEV